MAAVDTPTVGLAERIANLTLINEETKYRLELQREASDRVDTKTTLLLGFAATAAQLVVANRTKMHEGFLAGALLAYAGAFAFGVFGIFLLHYHDAPNPRHLAKHYGAAYIDHTLAALIGTRIAAVEDNRKRHRRKTVFWGYCLIFLAIGLVSTTLALLGGPINP